MKFHTWKLKDWEFGIALAISKEAYINVSLFKRCFTLSIK